MKNIYVLADNMMSALGFSTQEHINQLLKGTVGIQQHHKPTWYHPHFNAALIDEKQWANKWEAMDIKKTNSYSRLEQLFIMSIQDALTTTSINVQSEDVGLVIASTKGNIELIGSAANEAKQKLALMNMGQTISSHFKMANRPIIICNACISGVLAIIVASRLLRMGKYKTVIVTGGDIVSNFTLSGFKALKAMSDQPCRPFDAERNGISLGDGCASMILSVEKKYTTSTTNTTLLGGGVSNDANHISAPSREAVGLQLAIDKALKTSMKTAKEIDFISAHGTATIYNDEMEAKGFYAKGLADVPLNSFKGYWGHTLGAAGILEAIMAYHSVSNNVLFPSQGYTDLGVSQPINVIKKIEKQSLKTCLKTTSGFGGCNGAVIFEKRDVYGQG